MKSVNQSTSSCTFVEQTGLAMRVIFNVTAYCGTLPRGQIAIAFYTDKKLP